MKLELEFGARGNPDCPQTLKMLMTMMAAEAGASIAGIYFPGPGLETDAGSGSDLRYGLQYC